ncbi:putative SOS response-associated peptidase [Paratrimastix pyriformis]|uniref:SOS response-associated peptidase n=1 Tax=Paratrimastix pyriformis TaxID=342808 RepID=A0ABQ8UGC2_9EUKA|nr:putative SOS response-associated peptidase [Paratrimastix pyriformis]
MCGRVACGLCPERIATHFDIPHERVDDARLSNFHPSYNMGPSSHAPIICAQATGMSLTAMQWGLVPMWMQTRVSKGEGHICPLINARSDTLREKSSFSRLAHCVMVVDGYYEWRKVDNTRVPYLIRLPEDQPMYLACIYDTQPTEDGTMSQNFVILTTEPASPIAFIHDRMPAVLRGPAEVAGWLRGDALHSLGLTEATDLLRPYPDPLVFHPVSPLVNSVRNQGRELLVPMTEEAALREAAPGKMKKTSALAQAAKGCQTVDKFFKPLAKSQPTTTTTTTVSPFFAAATTTPAGPSTTSPPAISMTPAAPATTSSTYPSTSSFHAAAMTSGGPPPATTLPSTSPTTAATPPRAMPLRLRQTRAVRHSCSHRPSYNDSDGCLPHPGKAPPTAVAPTPAGIFPCGSNPGRTVAAQGGSHPTCGSNPTCGSHPGSSRGSNPAYGSNPRCDSNPSSSNPTCGSNPG